MTKDLLELNLQKLSFPEHLSHGIFLKGCLFAATPIDSKPKNMTHKRWAEKILFSASQPANCKLAVHRSFWSSKWGNDPLQNQLDKMIIKLNDTFEQHDYYWGFTPIRSACEIIKALRSGEDVLIPTAKHNVPGFIFALFHFIFGGYMEHPHKLDATLSQCYEYDVTPLQMGYFFGFHDRENILIELGNIDLKDTRYNQF